jgi:hypothetical protein
VALGAGEAIVRTGPNATHQIACHNPPTADEAAAGRPLRRGFRAAPAPGGPAHDALDGLDTPADIDALESAPIGENLGSGPGGSSAGLPLESFPPEADA